MANVCSKNREYCKKDLITQLYCPKVHSDPAFYPLVVTFFPNPILATVHTFLSFNLISTINLLSVKPQPI